MATTGQSASLHIVLILTLATGYIEAKTKFNITHIKFSGTVPSKTKPVFYTDGFDSFDVKLYKNTHLRTLLQDFRFQNEKEIRIHLVRKTCSPFFHRVELTPNPIFSTTELIKMGHQAQRYLCPAMCEPSTDQPYLNYRKFDAHEDQCLFQQNMNGFECGNCRCDEMCAVYDDCCFNSDGSLKPRPANFPNFKFSCLMLQFYGSSFYVVNAKKSFSIVQSPLPDSAYRTYLKTLCLACEEDDDNEKLYVVANGTSFVFCNYACASYFGIEHYSFIRRARRKCGMIEDPLTSQRNHTSTGGVCDESEIEVAEELDEARRCSHDYMNLVDECPIGGSGRNSKTKKENDFLRYMCQAYRYPVWMSGSTEVYNNLFCAVCNGKTPKVCTAFELCDDSSGLGAIFPSIHETTTPRQPLPVFPEKFSRFVFVMNYESSMMSPALINRPRSLCGKGQWMDSSNGKCRIIQCSSWSDQTDASCRHRETSALGLSYTVKAVVYLEDSQFQNAPTDHSSVWTNGVIYYLNTVLGKLANISQEFELLFGHMIQDSRRFPISDIQQTSGNETEYFSDNLDSIPHVFIQFEIEVAENITEQDVELTLYEVFNARIDFHVSTINNVSGLIRVIHMINSDIKYFAFFKKDKADEFCCRQYPIDDKLQSPVNTESRTFYNQAICPSVELSNFEFVLPEGPHGDITLLPSNVSIESQYVTIIPEQAVARICINRLRQPARNLVPDVTRPTSVTRLSQWQAILGTVLLMISVLCLFLTILSYIFVLPLHTIPAKNNLALCIILLTYMINEMLIDDLLANVENRYMCILRGMWVHYLFLAYIFWMNSCSFHMLWTFAIRAVADLDRSRRFYAYFAYSMLMPFAFIALNMGISWARTNSIGYSSVSCFLDWTLVAFIVTTAPICLVVIANVFFFGFTVRAIKQTPKMQRASGGEVKNVYVFLKLSTFCGLWVIAVVLSNIPGLAFMLTVGIFLLCSQGILLFWAFVCNQRCLGLWKDKLRQCSSCSKNRKQSVSTRETA